MNKKYLIGYASLQSGKTQQSLRENLDILLSTVADILNERESVTLSNFGAFKAVSQEERYVWNPQERKRVLTQPRIKVIFKTSPQLIRNSRIAKTYETAFNRVTLLNK